MPWDDGKSRSHSWGDLEFTAVGMVLGYIYGAFLSQAGIKQDLSFTANLCTPHLVGSEGKRKDLRLHFYV